LNKEISSYRTQGQPQIHRRNSRCWDDPAVAPHPMQPSCATTVCSRVSPQAQSRAPPCPLSHAHITACAPSGGRVPLPLTPQPSRKPLSCASTTARKQRNPRGGGGADLIGGRFSDIYSNIKVSKVHNLHFASLPNVVKLYCPN
jgi:hypothetical protein